LAAELRALKSAGGVDSVSYPVWPKVLRMENISEARVGQCEI